MIGNDIEPRGRLKIFIDKDVNLLAAVGDEFYLDIAPVVECDACDDAEDSDDEDSVDDGEEEGD